MKLNFNKFYYNLNMASKNNLKELLKLKEELKQTKEILKLKEELKQTKELLNFKEDLPIEKPIKNKKEIELKPKEDLPIEKPIRNKKEIEVNTGINLIFNDDLDDTKSISSISSSDSNTNNKKKKAISSTIKKLVWNINIGEEIGKAKCLCCKSTYITQISFHCGHILAETNGGETIVSNLKPICQNCNSSMGTKNMNDFMETLK